MFMKLFGEKKNRKILRVIYHFYTIATQKMICL